MARPLNIWECLRLQIAHSYTKVCEEAGTKSLILPRSILASYPPGSLLHIGFGTEVLPTDNFYSKLIFHLWYEWIGQCSRIYKISTPLHLIPEWKALNQGMLQEARHILGWHCIILLQRFGQTSHCADCSVSINTTTTIKHLLRAHLQRQSVYLWFF